DRCSNADQRQQTQQASSHKRSGTSSASFALDLYVDRACRIRLDTTVECFVAPRGDRFSCRRSHVERTAFHIDFGPDASSSYLKRSSSTGQVNGGAFSYFNAAQGAEINDRFSI